MKIICYVRTWNRDYFESLAETAFPEARIETISDLLGSDSLGFQEKLINTYNSVESKNEFTESDIYDIIQRCRLLRRLDTETATTLIYSYWHVISDIFNQSKPDLILSIIVDSYVMDLIRLYAEKHNIPFFGLVGTFVNGYFRITNRGEHIKTYDPTEENVEEAFFRLYYQKETPYYMRNRNTLFSNYLKSIRNRGKNIIKYPYFSLKRLIGDKYCYHYWSNQVMMKESFNLNISNLKINKNWEKKISGNTKNIYLPLQYVPEATVDYWVKDIRHTDYYNVLFELLDSSERNIIWFIKEHPSIIGLRHGKIYRKLNQLNNIVIVPTTTSSAELISKTDITFVWTGTAGFEAALAGKPVIHLGEPFYISGNNFFYLDSIENINVLINQIPKDIITTDDQRKDMIRYLLSGLLPGTFLHPKRVKGKWVSDYQHIPVIAKSLSDYFYANNF